MNNDTSQSKKNGSNSGTPEYSSLSRSERHSRVLSRSRRCRCCTGARVWTRLWGCARAGAGRSCLVGRRPGIGSNSRRRCRRDLIRIVASRERDQFEAVVRSCPFLLNRGCGFCGRRWGFGRGCRINNTTVSIGVNDPHVSIAAARLFECAW